jgi:TetR/AcrR family transcriptional regulator, regulator of mycofactocin system
LRGRPRSVSPREIGHVALELFARDGFEQTTMDDIADALTISRRTLFRYFPSKNDMVWGEFDSVLERLRRQLAQSDPAEPLAEAITRAVVASNRYPPEQLPELRIRMTLITTVPALQAHSMLRYAAWRNVIAEFAARRLEVDVDALVPQTIAHAALGASMAAFVHWVDHPGADLEANLRDAYAQLSVGFAVSRTRRAPQK